MNEFSRITDCGDERGHCSGCRWWQADHDQSKAVEDLTIGLCMHPEISHFSLQVSGHSGCNRYEVSTGEGARQLVTGCVGR